jgi:23S rRNA (uracil1939-C5)-methyltransferase
VRYLLRFSDYQVKGIPPVDMFPHTDHIETIVLLARE